MENIKINLELANVKENDLQLLNDFVISQDEKLISKTGDGNDSLGWLDIDNIISKSEIEDIKKTGKYLKENFEKIIIIGVGGSYLGAKAIINALKNNFKEEKIIFAGYNLDSAYLKDLINYLQNINYAIVVISKSGTTLEPALNFRFLTQDLIKKYGKKSLKDRVIAITDAKKGILKEFADKNGIKTFSIANDIGGRYSVLTPVGLLPIAISGFDIEKILSGAKDMKKIIDTEKNILNNPAYLYAGIRNLFLQNNKNIEILASFDLKLKTFSEWWIQLFGESEGKNGKGIFPTSLQYTTDLHSMGQFVQEGQRIFFETIFIIENDNINLKIPFVENDEDKLNFISNKTFEEINKSALYGTIKAHNSGKVDIIKIIIPEINEYYLGQLIYFFLRSCAISAYILGVNPFNQPGVEAYKQNMMEIINN